MLRIALVDDEPSVLRVLSLHLQAIGHQVHAFETWTEARAWLCEHTVDVLIIDEKLQNRSGSELVQELKLLRPGDPIRSILMSGCPRDELSVIADEFLQKPFSAENLDAALLRVAATLGCDAISQPVPAET